MKNQFFLTLPSNSSFSVFPNNTTANFTTQLSTRITLKGEWEVTLVEFQFPLTMKNISSTNNIIYLVKKDFIAKYHIPGGYSSIADIVHSINNVPEIGKYIYLELVGLSKIKVKRVHEQIDDGDKILLHPNLSFQLGFDAHANLLKTDAASRNANMNLGIANQIYVYCDLVEPQLVGDTMASLLRIVSVKKSNYMYGSYASVAFENPHYVPLSRHDFETVEIDLRDDTGSHIPFLLGSSLVKLHFRRLSNN